MKQEENLSLAVSRYLMYQYPGVVFTTEAGGLKLGRNAAKKLSQQRSGRGIPDIIILQPSVDGLYHGLCLELKQQTKSPFLKNGNLSTNEHIQEQWQVIQKLRKVGYSAHFAVGYEQATTMIDYHLKKRK
jgi:hypothetical protein